VDEDSNLGVVIPLEGKQVHDSCSELNNSGRDANISWYYIPNTGDIYVYKLT
jgi:hypothetical protein